MKIKPNRRRPQGAVRAPAVPLPLLALVCRGCGVAVPSPRSEEVVTALGRRRADGAGIAVLDERVVEVRVARCPACQLRRSRAQAILDAHPRVRLRLGGRSYVLGLIDAALAALEVLGIPWAQVEGYTRSDRDVRLLLDRLPVAGAELYWSAGLEPIIEADRDLLSCSPSPWAHVSDADVAEAREAFASMLERRIERPRPFAPPADGARGCLLCGVGALYALPSRARSEGVWTGPLHATPSTLGGQPRPEPVRGYLCPACADAVARTGAIGPTALERALIAHLGVRPRGFADVELSGFRAWAALPEGTPPNATPWEHERGLDEFARDLRRVV